MIKPASRQAGFFLSNFSWRWWWDILINLGTLPKQFATSLQFLPIASIFYKLFDRAIKIQTQTCLP